MARLTVYDHNRAKALFRLEHHPDCKGATYQEGEDGKSLVFTAKNGTRIRVGDSVDWLRDEDGSHLDKKLAGAMGLMNCLLNMYRTVDTMEELEDLVCELYDVQDTRFMGSAQERLEKAFMYIVLHLDHKIGFRNLYYKVPKELKDKAASQLRYMLEKKTWDWGSLTWIPLKELVKLVCTEDYIDVQWQLGIISCATDTLFDHYKKHGKLANRYAEELQRRVTALDEDGHWPEVA